VQKSSIYGSKTAKSAHRGCYVGRAQVLAGARLKYQVFEGGLPAESQQLTPNCRRKRDERVRPFLPKIVIVRSETRSAAV